MGDISMLLADWLKAENLTQKAAARRANIDPRVFHRYVAGTRVPDARAMRALYILTEGAVTANDFYELPEPQPWLIALAPPERRESFKRLGWQHWPTEEAAESGLMRRNRRPDEGWRETMAELAYLTMIPPPWAGPRTDPRALAASAVDPD